MSYLVLARKYRPQTFDDVIGQEKTVEKLKGALKSGRIGHAFLFSGPRGTGKTTCARILAKEFNKAEIPAHPGLDLGLSSSLDIIEIDGASNNGVDDVRVLRDNVQLMSMSGGYKVYIIDEVHMLSSGAFNALLKTIEEPPPHVKFIFATTDPNKVPITVVSRCQRFDFSRIPQETMVKALKDICTKEKIEAEEDALVAVAKAAQGSMRDALTVLDQLIAFSGGLVKASEVNSMLGLVETAALFNIADAVAAKDPGKALSALDLVLDGGKDVRQLTKDLISHFRNLMVMKAGGNDLQALVDYPKAHKEALFRQAGLLTMRAIIAAMDELIKSEETSRFTDMPRLALELALIKMTADVPLPAMPQAVTPPRPVAVVPTQTPAPAPVSAVRPIPVSVTKPAGSFVKNNKGSVDVAPLMPRAEPLSSTEQPPFTLADVKQAWNKITFAASRRKITVGTCLQSGYPFAWEKGSLVIAFTRDHAFQKDCINTAEALAHIEGAIEESLGSRCRVDLCTVDGEIERQHMEVVEKVLEAFDGEVVNEWHDDGSTPNAGGLK